MTPSSPEPDMQGESPGRATLPLRVGLLLDSLEQPRWAHELVQGLQRSAAVEIAAVFIGSTAPSGSHAAENRLSHLGYRLYRQLDRWKFLGQTDALQRSDITELIRPWTVLEVQTVSSPGGVTFSDDAQTRILEMHLDVLLFAGEKGYWGEIPRLARHGLWAYRFGTSQPPAFWEVVEGIPLVPSGLYICADRREPERQIYGSVGSGDRRSPSRVSNHLHFKTSQFAIRKLEQLHALGPEALQPEWCPLPDPVPLPQGSGVPGGFGMSLAFVRIMSRYISDAYRERFRKEVRWDIGFRFGGELLDPSGLYLVSPPKEHFWADPFPWQHENRNYIFFEELPYDSEKGYLRVMEVHRDGSCGEPVTVLEKDYHLSYPFLFEWRGELYMLPETLENRTIELYRCISFPHRWELYKVLMEDIPAADATLLQRDGKWWMFVSLAVDSGSCWDEVSLFHADSPLGPWTPHPQNPIRSDVRAARPAGWLFERDGRLYRPAQDCSECYGYALAINEIRRLDTERYEEVEVKRILPRAHLGEMGIHTVNQAGDLIVFDRFAPEVKSGRLP